MNELSLDSNTGLWILGFFAVLLIIDWSWKHALTIKITLEDRKRKSKEELDKFNNKNPEPFSIRDQDFIDYN